MSDLLVAAIYIYIGMSLIFVWIYIYIYIYPDKNLCVLIFDKNQGHASSQPQTIICLVKY